MPNLYSQFMRSIKRLQFCILLSGNCYSIGDAIKAAFRAIFGGAFENGVGDAVGNAINAYVARLQRAAHTDPVLSIRFMRVANLLDHPTALFAPSTVWRVFRGSGSATNAGRQSATGSAASIQRTSASS